MAFGNLVLQGQISKVFMGAHQLCKIDGVIRKFVNTAGSLMISKTCAAYNLPLIVVAETEKIVDYSDEASLHKIAFTSEESLTRSFSNEAQSHRTILRGIRIENYGYDIVPVEKHVEIVTD
jgi:translation initiation factor 2B subunit (eIF-2B alpha/beta/delta family)